MLIDTTAPSPPAVCWFIDRTRVRAGLGPQRIEPTGWYRLHDGTPVSVEVGRGVLRSVADCYTTERAAGSAGGRLVRAEILLERSRATAIMARLEQAQRAARAADMRPASLPTDAQLLAALGPCGK